jgi:hypothetical protein
MTTTEDSVALTSPARPQPVLLCVGVGSAVVVGWVLYRHYWSDDIWQRLAQGNWYGERLWAVALLSVLVLSVPYAVALLLWGRGITRALSGAAVALGAGLFLWGWDEIFANYVWDPPLPGTTSVQVYEWGGVLVVAALVPLAWGLARRSGWGWLPGVLVGPLVAAILRELTLRWTWWGERVSGRGVGYHWQLEAVVFTAPFVLAALACWAIEARGRRTPEMGSSAPAGARAPSGADDPMR